MAEYKPTINFNIDTCEIEVSIDTGLTEGAGLIFTAVTINYAGEPIKEGTLEAPDIIGNDTKSFAMAKDDNGCIEVGDSYEFCFETNAPNDHCYVGNFNIVVIDQKSENNFTVTDQKSA